MDEEKFFLQEFKNLINLYNKNKLQFLDKLVFILSNPLNTNGKSVIKEIEQMSEIINTNQRNSDITYNEEISKSCEARLEFFLNKNTNLSKFDRNILKKFQEENNINDIQDSLDKCNIKDFSLFSLVQESGETFEKIIAKLILYYDKTNNILSILNNPIISFYGFGVRKFKEDYLLNIIFLDKYTYEQPILNTKGSNFTKLDNKLLDFINKIRTNPEDYKNYFNKLMNNSEIENGSLSIDRIKKFNDILTKYKSMHNFNRKIILDVLSQKILSKYQTLSNFVNGEISIFRFNENDMIEYSKNYIKTDENIRIIGFICKHTENQQEILKNLLFSNNNISNRNYLDLLFDNLNLINIGISFEIKNDLLYLIIILVNDVEKISLINLAELFKKELKKLRNNPKELIPEIEKIKNTYNNIERYSSLADNIEYLLGYLSQSKTFPEIEENEDLNDACKEYCSFLIDPKQKNFYTEDDDLLRLRLGHYVHGFKNTCQFVIYHNKDISEIILNLLLEENVKVNKKGLVFLGKYFKFYGIAERVIRGKTLLVLIFTDYIQKFSNVNERLKSHFLKDLTILRKYPRAMIKYLYDTNEDKPSYYDIYKIEKIKNKKDVLSDFLFNAKVLPPLEEKHSLTLISEKFIFDIINKKTVLIESDNKDTKDYKENTSKFFNLEHIINEVNLNQIRSRKDTKNNNLDLLKNLFTQDLEIPKHLQNIAITNFNVSRKAIFEILFNEEYRSILFSPLYKYFGISINEKREFLYIILCDDLNEKIPLVDYNISVKTRFLRPNITKDEEEEIKNNFKKLDVSNKGKIFPHLLINLMEKNNLSEKNIIYYISLQLYLSEKNTKALNIGITIEEFIEYTKKALSLLSLKENIILFNLLKSKTKSRNIDFNEFKSVLIEQNFKFLDSEAESIFSNICYPDTSISQKVFVDTMESIRKISNRYQQE